MPRLTGAQVLAEMELRNSGIDRVMTHREYPNEPIDQAVAQRDADYLSLVRLLHTCEDSA